MRRGTPKSVENTESSSFIMTAHTRKLLKQIARIVSSSSVAILLEGPTSSGKTSTVEYLCALVGRRCIRINNHQHTDLQEYLGHYSCD